MTEKKSVNRPHHGIALYVKEYFQIQKVVKMQCNSYLLAYTAIKEDMIKLLCCKNTPKSLQAEFRKDIHRHLRQEIDLNAN